MLSVFTLLERLLDLSSSCDKRACVYWTGSASLHIGSWTHECFTMPNSVFGLELGYLLIVWYVFSSSPLLSTF